MLKTDNRGLSKIMQNLREREGIIIFVTKCHEKSGVWGHSSFAL